MYLFEILREMGFIVWLWLVTGIPAALIIRSIDNEPLPITIWLLCFFSGPVGLVTTILACLYYKGPKF